MCHIDPLEHWPARARGSEACNKAAVADDGENRELGEELREVTARLEGGIDPHQIGCGPSDERGCLGLPEDVENLVIAEQGHDPPIRLRRLGLSRCSNSAPASSAPRSKMSPHCTSVASPPVHVASSIDEPGSIKPAILRVVTARRGRRTSPRRRRRRERADKAAEKIELWRVRWLL